jgi:hypothetical protein
MHVTNTSFTVAEYCQQLATGLLVVNKDYQRSNKVWPPAARSYLIETLLLGYPIPKISLYQKTDLKSRKTYKEIVDGQQRSQAINDFYTNKLRLSGRSDFSGRTYDTLEDESKAAFVNYSINCDLFVNATEEDIRQVFRRINAYTVPLNAAEKRHAIYQGELKWFIVEMCEKYSQLFKTMGVYTESQLGRMNDAAILSDIIYTLHNGIKSQSDKLINDFYRDNDSTFDGSAKLRSRLKEALAQIGNWNDLHNGPLMKQYSFYTLLLALLHKAHHYSALDEHYTFDKKSQPSNNSLTNLSTLASAIEQPNEYKKFSKFVEACSEATNRIGPRVTRFKWLCKALESELLE